MIKVLIVDDEERQRSGLIRHVNWEAYGMVVAGEAESAQQALEFAMDNPPDLLITDIRLIGTDGLELSRSMLAAKKEMKIVMITGYEEFEYAKTAIDIGIEAFLIKPIDFLELNKTLERISKSFFNNLKKQEEELQLRNQLKELLPFSREKFLHELITGLTDTEERIRMRSRYLQMFGTAGSYTVIIITRDFDGFFKYTSEESMQLDYIKIRRIAGDILCDILEATTALFGNSVLIVRCPAGSEPNEILEHKLDMFHQEAEKELNCKINIGIGSAVDSLQQIADSFRLAQRAISQRLLKESGQIIYWNDIGWKNIHSGVEMSILITNILDSLRVGDRRKIDEIFETMVRTLIESDSISETETECICLELVNGATKIAGEMNEPLEKQPGTVKELWKHLLDCSGTIQMLQETRKILIQFCNHISERENNRYRSIVRSALKYIGEHYSEDLSLQDVAKKVYLSPSYLGTLLRAELKQPFTDYLTGVRIEKAKELLKNPQLKLYEISDHVGYQNSAYFCKVFKQYTGMSPKEFRNAQDINLDE